MRKRFLVMTIVLAIFVSLSMSVTALAKSVGEEGFAKVKEVITDEIGDVKDKIDEQTEAKEVATTTKINKTEEVATIAGTQGKEALLEMISVNSTPLEIQSIETEATEPENSETETTEPENSETETTEPENSETETTEPAAPTESENSEKESAEVPKEELFYPQEEGLEDWLRIILMETQEDDTRIYSLNNRLYTVPDVIVNEEPRVTDSGYVEKIYNVPQYFQQAYPKTRYGNHGTVSSHGCGITSVAMVFSYLLDREILPDELAAEYGRYNTEHGSAWSLFDVTAEDYGLEVTRVHLWQDVVEALENGCVVISNVRENLFTAGGHFIVYYGITEDGKILVRDPNIYNFGKWSATALKEGFYNGFEDKYVKYSFPCWIYAPKDLDAIANAAS